MKYVIFIYIFFLFANSLCAQRGNELSEFGQYLCCGHNVKHPPMSEGIYKLNPTSFDSLHSFAVYEINVASNGKIDSWRLIPDSDINFTPKTKTFTEAIIKKAAEEFTFKYFQGRMLYPFHRVCHLEQIGEEKRGLSDLDAIANEYYLKIIVRYSFKNPWYTFFYDIMTSGSTIYCTWLY